MIEIVDIDEIKIKVRVRKDLGDLMPLMDSMKRHGLLNPLILNRDRELIAGHRRYESAKRLGWTAIQCRIVDHRDQTSMLEIEIEENTARKDFSSDEMADALIRLDRLRNPGRFKRFIQAIARFFGRIRAALFRRRRRSI